MQGWICILESQEISRILTGTNEQRRSSAEHRKSRYLTAAAAGCKTYPDPLWCFTPRYIFYGGAWQLSNWGTMLTLRGSIRSPRGCRRREARTTLGSNVHTYVMNRICLNLKYSRVRHIKQHGRHYKRKLQCGRLATGRCISSPGCPWNERKSSQTLPAVSPTLKKGHIMNMLPMLIMISTKTCVYCRRQGPQK